jgi:hypothetical protein
MTEIIEWHTANLSLAIRLKDDYTKEQPIGPIKISLKDENRKTVKNSSGYYLFLGPPSETYTVQIKSEIYFGENIQVQLSDIDPKKPEKEIVLKPNPAYPFPNGATLIRGMVIDQADNPVPNANVQVTEKNLNTVTTERGEFVLYFPPLRENDVKKENGSRFIKTTDNKKLSIKATFGAHSTTVSLKEDVEEGVTTKTTAIKLNISS